MSPDASSSRETAASCEHFSSVAKGVMRDLQGALAEMIATTPAANGAIRKASELQKALRLDRKLTWQLYKIATTPDPVSAGTSVPGRVSMDKLLKAMGDRAVPPKVIVRVASAYERFEGMVVGHAGDREVFDSMVSALQEGGSEQLDLTHKRAAFRANSHFLGVHASTMLQCWMAHPSEHDPERYDMASIRGMVRLERLRQNAPSVISRLRVTNNDGSFVSAIEREPIDPKGRVADGIALMTDYCSKPLPEFRVVKSPAGFIEVEIVGDQVGRSSAATCFTGEVSRRGALGYCDEVNDDLSAVARVRTPCGMLVLDVLIYDEMFGKVNPTVSVFNDAVGGDLPTTTRPNDRLPVREFVRHLGHGVDCLHSPDVPRYAEMVHSALERLRWDHTKFDVYRCCVEYPLVPSSVVMKFNLPDKDGYARGQR